MPQRINKMNKPVTYIFQLIVDTPNMQLESKTSKVEITLTANDVMDAFIQLADVIEHIQVRGLRSGFECVHELEH